MFDDVGGKKGMRFGHTFNHIWETPGVLGSYETIFL